MMSSWFFSLIFFIGLVMLLFSLSVGFNVELSVFLTKSFMDLLMVINKLSLLFVLLILVISFLVFLWSLFYMLNSEKLTAFFVILFLFVVSMLMLVLSNSFFFIFLGWEGLGLTSFLLIIFYQNWMSFSGGLLTLLTNRLGDSILMMSFAYWTVFNSFFVSYLMSAFCFFVFVFLSFTKSAQTPFTSWLPAAMAAPTPVSALVHSSTLVTAGVWMMIRFGGSEIMNTLMWVTIGFSTLMVASLAALMESDAKKVVALSTLSQLGLMYLALFLCGSFITLFHLMMHALAKANLFLMVGNMLHYRFSQQDIRLLSSGTESSLISIMTFLSLLSLSGMSFTSGFYSKDFILNSHYSSMNSIVSFLIILCVISLTVTYCYKLFMKLMLTNINYVNSQKSSISSLLPSIILSFSSILMGWFFIMNLGFFKILMKTWSGFYWVFLLLLPFLIIVNSSLLMSFFKNQINLVFGLMKSVLLISKKASYFMDKGLVESVLLSLSLNPISVLLINPMSILLLSLVILMVFIL